MAGGTTTTPGGGHMKFEAVSYRLRRFEDQEVAASRLIIPRKTIDIPIDLTVDEKIEVTFKAIICGASFDVDKKTGELIRTHKIDIFDTDIETM
jgi:hypothetical protein